MRQDYELMGPDRDGAGSVANAATWLGRVLTFGMGAVLLVVGLMVSLLVFALATAAAVLIIGLLWWKTREQRRQMREPPLAGRIIDGESVRETHRY